LVNPKNYRMPQVMRGGPLQVIRSMQPLRSTDIFPICSRYTSRRWSRPESGRYQGKRRGEYDKSDLGRTTGSNGRLQIDENTAPSANDGAGRMLGVKDAIDAV
jgi:hypothetical protein